MRNNSDILEELRCADAILARAGRERPNGVKSCLNRSLGGVEPSEAQINWAKVRADAVMTIPNKDECEAVNLAMLTDHGEPQYSRREIAAKIDVSERTVTRLLKAGLYCVSLRLRGAVVIPV